MLTVFASELNSTQSELDTLLAKAQALRGQMKSLKTAQNKAFKVVDNLKNLVSELPELAIAQLKQEILSLFPSDPEPTEVLTNFVTEVPKAKEATPWNPAHFGDLHFNAEDNGQLNLLSLADEEPPEPDDYPDLASFEAAWAVWEAKQTGEAEEELTHVCAKDFFNAIDLSGENWEQMKAALKPVRQQKTFLIVKGETALAEDENTSDDDDQWPEVEEKKDFDYSYIAKVEVSELCFYLKKPNQEIVAAYLAVANRNVGKEWVDYLNLMGCVAKVRKAKRFENGVRWEVKATKIPHELILQVDKARPSLYSAVPHGNAEFTKKSLSGKDETNENLSDSKTLTAPLHSQPEKSEISTEQKANDDAEIILKGESAKADILPNYSQQNQQKVFPGDLIRVKSNCHHKAVVGLTGVVTIASQTGCIAQFENVGNRWLTNEQVEIIKESQLVS